VEQQEGGYVGEGLVGNWLEPFSEEFRCFVEDFVELCWVSLEGSIGGGGGGLVLSGGTDGGVVVGAIVCLVRCFLDSVSSDGYQQ